MRFPLCIVCLAVSVGAQAENLVLTPTTLLPARWGSGYSAKMHSTALGTTRSLSIFVPKDFDSTKHKYPILFFTDGEYYFEKAVVATRELTLSGYMPESIVVAIENPERRLDMTPAKMKMLALEEGQPRAEKFLQFMVNELRPEIVKRFRGTNPTVYIGHSHGGILAHLAAAKWRKEVPFIVSLDAPVNLDNKFLETSLTNSIAEGGRLRLISVESKFGWLDADWLALQKAAPEDWMLNRRKLENEDHETMVFTGFYLGLKDVFSDYSFVNYRKLSAGEAFTKYEGLTAAYGAPVEPPLNTLNQAVDELTITGDGPAAHRALNLLADNYGAPKNRADLEKNIDEAAG